MIQETNKELLNKDLLGEERQGEVLYSEELQEASGELKTGKRFYIESYGCAMNFNDSEIVASVLNKSGYTVTKDIEEADAIFINTCSIRENAEDRVRQRIRAFKSTKKRNKTTIGVLGCMAERLKKKLLEEEKLVDVVCGPDAYRDLPRLLGEAESGQKMVNVLLSREETYADISPVRLDNHGVTSFVSITRGCDNMCSFCVVPFTRGRERSRNAYSIVAEAQDLFDNGYREVTLLGQNVDSYKWENKESEEKVNFTQLLIMVAKIDPQLRVRFSTSHPKDITDDVLRAIADHKNICNHIHLPVQSGSTSVLERMNRSYSREWYLDRVAAVRRIVPDCALTTDIITGFCGETDEDQAETLSMLEAVHYEAAYMYWYSERPGTLAARKYEDDVPLKIKKSRLTEVIALQQVHSKKRNDADVGKVMEVLIERESARSTDDWMGRTQYNKKVNFAKNGKFKKGSYATVKIVSCTHSTLRGEIFETEKLGA